MTNPINTTSAEFINARNSYFASLSKEQQAFLEFIPEDKKNELFIKSLGLEIHSNENPTQSQGENKMTDTNNPFAPSTQPANANELGINLVKMYKSGYTRRESYVSISRERIDAVAEYMIRNFLTGFSNIERSADGGIVAWNFGDMGGSTVSYFSPFVIEKISNNEEVVSFELNRFDPAGKYEVRAARKVVLDVITNALDILEEDFHTYPHVNGKYQESAGYLKVTHGVKAIPQTPGIIINAPKHNGVQQTDDGRMMAVKNPFDFEDKTGWVELHCKAGDGKTFDLGAFYEEPAHAETFDFKTTTDGSVKSFLDKLGTTRFEHGKNDESHAASVNRRHNVLAAIARGEVIKITDWMNEALVSTDEKENGVGEQDLFLKKVVMDKTFIRVDKQEYAKSAQVLKSTLNHFKKGATEVAIETDVLVKNVYDSKFQPVQITVSEIMANYTKFVTINPIGKFPLSKSPIYIKAIDLGKLVSDLNSSNGKTGVQFFA